ncbi:GTP1/OBG [Fragilaria crotonensis]|nr:GTP1/OBG [Fragilaria crotonensis]
MISTSCLARTQIPRAVTSTTVRWWQMNLPQNFPGQEKIKKKRRGRASYRFVDQIRLRAVGGRGGKGSLSMESVTARGHKKRPDGGHGGRGGHVILLADPAVQTLKLSHPVAVADWGTNGTSQDRSGGAGKNKIIRVPCGVIVRRVLDHDEDWDPEERRVIKAEDYAMHDNRIDDGDDDALLQNGEYHIDDEGDDDDDDDDEDDDDDDDDEDEDDDEYGHIPRGQLSIVCEGLGGAEDTSDEDDDFFEAGDTNDTPRERVTLIDLDKPGSWCLVARGGLGGRGNCDWFSIHGPLPEPNVLLDRARPQDGEVAYLELELKMIADLGLVGFPNAGKSSLLAAMSRATPKIAPYPFTTLHPLVGVIEYRDGYKVVVADVPGLVDGASEGRGRGYDFLRHIERTKALMYIVDSAGTDGRDPVDDLKVLVNELGSYSNGDLMNRPAIVAANKVDLLSKSDSIELFHELGKVASEAGILFNGEVMGISAGVTGEGLSPLSRKIRSLVQQRELELAVA